MGQIWSVTCFYKYCFISTHLCPFVYTLSVAAFVAQRHSWAVVTGTQRPAKPKLFIMWPLMESLLSRDQPTIFWATSQGRQALSPTLAVSLISGHRGPEMGGRNRNPESSQLWGEVLGNHWPGQGVIISLSLKKLPASFPKRSEAGPKGMDISSADRRNCLLYSLLEPCYWTNEQIHNLCLWIRNCVYFIWRQMGNRVKAHRCNVHEHCGQGSHLFCLLGR